MKIYAKQVAPEYQESPLFMEEWPENVYVFGNRHYKEHGGEYINNIKNSMYDAADELKALTCGGSYYDSFIDILADIIPAPDNKKEYSRADRLKWRALLLNYDAGAITDDDAITTALELITGDEYDAATIRGCCQGDWNNIIYRGQCGDADYSCDPAWLCAEADQVFEQRFFEDWQQAGFQCMSAMYALC